MARNYRELQEKMYARMTPAQLAAHRKRLADDIASIRLQRIRHLREMNQAEVAEALEVGQGSISRLEKQSDMRVSTLRDYIEAIGGRLEMRAVFPEQTVLVDIGPAETAAAK